MLARVANWRVAADPAHWDARLYESRWGQYITEREIDALRAGLGGASPGTAPDVGCGAGRWSAVMHEFGWRVVCTDVDPASLARCNARIPDARCIEVSPQDETLPVGSGEVQLVLVYEVHEVIQSAWFIPEAARALSPGGALVCSYWNPLSLCGAAYRVLGKVWGGEVKKGVKRFQDYYRGPTYRTFRDTLRANGFRIVREEGICWFPFTRESNSALVPIAVATERMLGLRRVPTLSPWVICVAMLDRE